MNIQDIFSAITSFVTFYFNYTVPHAFSSFPIVAVVTTILFIESIFVIKWGGKRILYGLLMIVVVFISFYFLGEVLPYMKVDDAQMLGMAMVIVYIFGGAFLFPLTQKDPSKYP